MLNSYYIVDGYTGKCAYINCQQNITDNDPFVTHISVKNCVAHKSCTAKALTVAEKVFKCGFCNNWVQTSFILGKDEYHQKLQEHEYQTVQRRDSLFEPALSLAKKGEIAEPVIELALSLAKKAEIAEPVIEVNGFVIRSDQDQALGE